MLLFGLLAAAPIRLTVEGGNVHIDGFDGGAALPRRPTYTLRSGTHTLKLERLAAATAIFVHVADGGLRAEVSEPAPKGVTLDRELRLDEAPRYALRNATPREYALHLPTLMIAPVVDGGAGEPKVLDCVIIGKLGGRTGLALGMWDESCFAEQAGTYRAMVFLVEAGADKPVPVQRVYRASCDFTFVPGRNRDVFRPSVTGEIRSLRQMLIGPGGETACVCEGSRVGPSWPASGPDSKPVGDFPHDREFMIQK